MTAAVLKAPGAYTMRVLAQREAPRPDRWPGAALVRVRTPAGVARYGAGSYRELGVTLDPLGRCEVLGIEAEPVSPRADERGTVVLLVRPIKGGRR